MKTSPTGIPLDSCIVCTNKFKFWDRKKYLQTSHGHSAIKSRTANGQYEISGWEYMDFTPFPVHRECYDLVHHPHDKITNRRIAKKIHNSYRERYPEDYTDVEVTMED